MKLVIPAAATILATALCAGADLKIDSVVRHRDSTLGLTVISGTIHLPAHGEWVVQPASGQNALEQVYLQVENWQEFREDGVRMRRLQIEERKMQSRASMANMASILLNYARTHGHRLPSSLEDPALLDVVPNYGNPWPIDRKRNLDYERRQIERFQSQAADYAILPSARFNQELEGGATNEPAAPILVELAPVQADGKHHVLLSNGSVELLAIDQALLAKHGLRILTKNIIDQEPKQKPSHQRIRVAALQRSTDAPEAWLEFKDLHTNTVQKVRWELRNVAAGDRQVLTQWAQLRMRTWTEHARSPDAALLQHWTNVTPVLYGGEVQPRRDAPGGRARRASMGSILGGRSAVEETLQMDGLASGENPDSSTSGSKPVPLREIRGVEVKAHPFSEMVKGISSSAPELASLVPADRAFFYAAKPGALRSLFGTDSEFVSRASAFGPTAGLDYRLLDRYAEALGLSPQLRDFLLHHSSVRECALFTPDLFFADGTDLTLIARTPSDGLLSTLVKPLLATLSDATGVATVPAGPGKAYWAVRGDLWFASTSRDELVQALNFHRGPRNQSLGASDEFRYMLHKLPLKDTTSAYVYFSDPFIRRLVSPEVKIAQYRRIEARLEMERLLAAALLRKLDVPGEQITVQHLIAMKYYTASSTHADIHLGTDLRVASDSFGTLARLKPLLSQELSTATPEEARAYRRYMENYSRYWRRYFDPIAMRFDAKGEKYSLTTFILPLIENSLYSSMRGWLPTNGRVARLPEFSPAPVAQFSLALEDAAWTEIARNLRSIAERYLGISSEFYDLLGPGLHVALADANPIIRVGGRDLTTAFAPDDARQVGGGMDFLVYVPIVLNSFTRPTSIAVELTEPDRARRLLENAAVNRFSMAGRTPWFGLQYYQLQNRPEWILSFRFLGMANLDFHLSIQDRFLVISNQPWGERPSISGSHESRLSGAVLSVHPEQIGISLPAHFASEAEAEREQVFSALGVLHPWVAAERCSPKQAMQRHSEHIGQTPTIDPADVSWDGRVLVHNRFGSVFEPHQPVHSGGDRFGVLNGLKSPTIEMQFEDDGLRTIIDWTFHAKTAR